MNIFLCCWRIPDGIRDAARRCLANAARLYPQLGVSETHWCDLARTSFVGCVHPPIAALGTRRYFHENSSCVCLYDGLPVDPNARFVGADAADLADNWEKLPEILEGQYTILRLQKTPPQLEVCNDFVGGNTTYYTRCGSGWLLSNRVSILRELTKATQLDPIGVSSFLAWGWTSADTTLLQDIRVMPPAQHWSWITGDNEPSRRTHYNFDGLTQVRCRRLTTGAVVALADELARICSRCAEVMPPVRCGLTGGQDSRVLAAILNRYEVNTSFITYGSPRASDALIAKRVARTLGIELNTDSDPDGAHIRDNEITGNWSSVVRDYVLQNDGMVELWQLGVMAGRQAHVAALPVVLGAQAAEITRGVFLTPWILLRPQSVSSAEKRLLADLTTGRGKWMTSDATLLAELAIQDFVRMWASRGFGGAAILELFYLLERGGRWGSVIARQSDPVCTYVRPFLFRSYLEACFAMPLLTRYRQAFHEHSLRAIAPELRAIPYSSLIKNTTIGRLLKDFGRGALSNSMLRKMRQKSNITSTSPQVDWLLRNKKEIREVCLDQKTSHLWQFVSRPHMQELFSASFNDASVLSRNAQLLLRIATLFYYELNSAERDINTTLAKSKRITDERLFPTS